MVSAVVKFFLDDDYFDIGCFLVSLILYENLLLSISEYFESSS